MKALLFCVIKANKNTSPMLLWGSAIPKPSSRTSKIVKLNKHWFVFKASGPAYLCLHNTVCQMITLIRQNKISGSSFQIIFSVYQKIKLQATEATQ